jgi:hypothetical protein
LTVVLLALSGILCNQHQLRMTFSEIIEVIFTKVPSWIQGTNVTLSTANASTSRQSVESILRFENDCNLGDSYKEWFKQKVPILKTIFHDGSSNSRSVRILLTTKHLDTRGPRKRRESYDWWARRQKWFCNYNDIRNATNSLAQLVGTGDHHGHSILMECPSTIEVLNSLSAIGPSGNVTYGNLTNFYRCQTNEHPISSLPPSLSFVAQTTLAFAPLGECCQVGLNTIASS